MFISQHSQCTQTLLYDNTNISLHSTIDNRAYPSIIYDSTAKGNHHRVQCSIEWQFSTVKLAKKIWSSTYTTHQRGDSVLN